jgi:hypothetical protein
VAVFSGYTLAELGPTCRRPVGKLTFLLVTDYLLRSTTNCPCWSWLQLTSAARLHGNTRAAQRGCRPARPAGSRRTGWPRSWRSAGPARTTTGRHGRWPPPRACRSRRSRGSGGPVGLKPHITGMWELSATTTPPTGSRQSASGSHSPVALPQRRLRYVHKDHKTSC